MSTEVATSGASTTGSVPQTCKRFLIVGPRQGRYNSHLVNILELEELVIGVRKPNLNELKELKVKLPVRLLVNLHYVKLTQSRPISEVVGAALNEYFQDMGLAKIGRPPGFGPDDNVPTPAGHAGQLRSVTDSTQPVAT